MERSWRAAIAGAITGCTLAAGSAFAAEEQPKSASSDERMERIEDHMRAMQEELVGLKQEKEVDQARVAEVEEKISGFQKLLERVKFGGYGSVRYEANSLDAQQSTFTFRRLVFTTEAQISERIRFYSELEYERFRELELERETVATEGGLQVVQAVEGTNESEIALEQAWVEYAFDPRLKLRAGGILVPLGRFNLNHDDNQWNLTRRSLVDRGVPVLPVTSAWDELGAGFTGNLEVGEGMLGYHIYVVNGVILEPELEVIAQMRNPSRDKLELEAEFQPSTGTFSNDVKEAKALTGRIGWQPEIGHELAFSFYTGRYTPDYLDDATLTSFAIDGITHFLGFDLEAEAVTTHWGHLTGVARAFAARALDSESANSSVFDPVLEPELEFELANLARRKSGYWVELRYPFWPGFFPNFGFDNPELIPVGRFEQVWFDDRLVEAEFSGGTLDEIHTEDRRIARGTLGLAYRPLPLVVFSAAYEYTWADKGSLMGLTNFLNASADEGNAHSFMVGVAFGF